MNKTEEIIGNSISESEIEAAKKVADTLRYIETIRKESPQKKVTILCNIENSGGVYDTLDLLTPEENKCCTSNGALLEDTTIDCAGNVASFIMPINDTACLVITKYWQNFSVNNSIIIKLFQSTEPQKVNYIPFNASATSVVNISGEDIVNDKYHYVTIGEPHSININEQSKPIKDFSVLATMLEDCFQDVGVDRKGNNK